MVVATTRICKRAHFDPTYIVKVRRKLDLDQREAAEIFGGGINAFSRYKNGKTKPSLALVKLLKMLDRHPDLLNEVRAAWRPWCPWCLPEVHHRPIIAALFLAWTTLSHAAAGLGSRATSTLSLQRFS